MLRKCLGGNSVFAAYEGHTWDLAFPLGALISESILPSASVCSGMMLVLLVAAKCRAADRTFAYPAAVFSCSASCHKRGSASTAAFFCGHLYQETDCAL